MVEAQVSEGDEAPGEEEPKGTEEEDSVGYPMPPGDEEKNAAKDGWACCSPTVLKWSSLAFLTVQTVIFSGTFRYARLQPGPAFSNLSVVVASELVKVLFSLALLQFEHGTAGSLASLKRMACSGHTLLMGVPGLVYCVQNALFFAGQSNLSVSLYQVCKQATILCTALLSTLLLQQRRPTSQWLALCLLCAGVALVAARGDSAARGAVSLGLVYTLAACGCSGLASVYTELMLKRASWTIGERNLQLAVYGTLWGLGGLVVAQPGLLMAPSEFFKGYGIAVWLVVFQQSVTGIATAFALKYADSVLKCVSKSMGMVLAVVVSRVIFGEGPRLTALHFQAGLFLALLGTVAYTLGFGALVSLLGLDVLWQRMPKVLPEDVAQKQPKENHEDEELVSLVPEPVLQRKPNTKECPA